MALQFIFSRSDSLSERGLFYFFAMEGTNPGPAVPLPSPAGTIPTRPGSRGPGSGPPWFAAGTRSKSKARKNKFTKYQEKM